MKKKTQHSLTVHSVSKNACISVSTTPSKISNIILIQKVPLYPIPVNIVLSHPETTTILIFVRTIDLFFLECHENRIT